MLELRIGALLVFASYLYYLVSFFLAKYNINIFHAFGYQENLSSQVRRVANFMLMCWCIGTTLFELQIWILPETRTRIICLVTLLVLIITLISQKAVRRMLPRILKGGLSEEHRLGDILLSDVLVSMANVFTDIVYSISLSWYGVPAYQSIDRFDHVGFGILIVACIPQAIRIKQCVVDFRRTRNKLHLVNLLKYIVTNQQHAIRLQIALLNPQVDKENATIIYYKNVLFIFLILNALFSLCWDLLADWRLLRLRSSRQAASLRFPIVLYYTAAVADLVLRFSFLLAGHTETSVYACQILEFSRRAMWAVFRVESEPVEMTDDIELNYTNGNLI